MCDNILLYVMRIIRDDNSTTSYALSIDHFPYFNKLLAEIYPNGKIELYTKLYHINSFEYKLAIKRFNEQKIKNNYF